MTNFEVYNKNIQEKYKSVIQYIRLNLSRDGNEIADMIETVINLNKKDTKIIKFLNYLRNLLFWLTKFFRIGKNNGYKEIYFHLKMKLKNKTVDINFPIIEIILETLADLYKEKIKDNVDLINVLTVILVLPDKKSSPLFNSIFNKILIFIDELIEDNKVCIGKVLSDMELTKLHNKNINVDNMNAIYMNCKDNTDLPEIMYDIFYYLTIYKVIQNIIKAEPSEELIAFFYKIYPKKTFQFASVKTKKIGNCSHEENNNKSIKKIHSKIISFARLIKLRVYKDFQCIYHKARFDKEGFVFIFAPVIVLLSFILNNELYFKLVNFFNQFKILFLRNRSSVVILFYIFIGILFLTAMFWVINLLFKIIGKIIYWFYDFKLIGVYFVLAIQSVCYTYILWVFVNFILSFEKLLINEYFQLIILLSLTVLLLLYLLKQRKTESQIHYQGIDLFVNFILIISLMMGYYSFIMLNQNKNEIEKSIRDISFFSKNEILEKSYSLVDWDNLIITNIGGLIETSLSNDSLSNNNYFNSAVTETPAMLYTDLYDFLQGLLFDREYYWAEIGDFTNINLLKLMTNAFNEYSTEYLSTNELCYKNLDFYDDYNKFTDFILQQETTNNETNSINKIEKNENNDAANSTNKIRMINNEHYKLCKINKIFGGNNATNMTVKYEVMQNYYLTHSDLSFYIGYLNYYQNEYERVNSDVNNKSFTDYAYEQYFRYFTNDITLLTNIYFDEEKSSLYLDRYNNSKKLFKWLIWGFITAFSVKWLLVCLINFTVRKKNKKQKGE